MEFGMSTFVLLTYKAFGFDRKIRRDTSTVGTRRGTSTNGNEMERESMTCN